MASTVATRYQRAYGLLVAIYLVFLIIPWVLTCYQARKPFVLTRALTRTKFNAEVHGIRQVDADTATRYTYALEALNYIAALIALPVVYEILARAAAIHVLRTRKTKRLNAEQLFALADRKFIQGLFQSSTGRRFSIFASSLIVLTVVHVIVRAVAVGSTWNQYLLAKTSPSDDTQLNNSETPYGWNVVPVGRSPTPQAIATLPALNVLTRVRQELIGSHPGEWRDKAWFAPDEDKYFVSTVKQGITTGLARNLALRMDSEVSCSKLYWKTDYPEGCPGGEQYPYRHPELKLDICVQGNGTGLVKGRRVSPWTKTNNRQRIKEKIFIRLIDEEFVGELNRSVVPSELWGWKGDIQCTAQTELGYFELGNDRNNNTINRIIRELDEADSELVALSAKHSWSAAEDLGYYSDMYNDRRASLERAGPVPGPLTLASRALFGNGSFYNISQRISSENPDRGVYSALMAASCPYPFQRHPLVQYECDAETRSDDENLRWGARGVAQLLNLFNSNTREQTLGDSRPHAGRELLDSALILANQAVMDLSVLRTDLEKFVAIYSTQGVAVRQFVMSDATMGVVSVFLGLQVLGILGFLCYTYRLPTWTATLDALAIARIAQQLKDGHLLRAIGLRTVTKEEMKKMSEIDAVIGLHEPIPLQAMSSPAAATLADRDAPGRGSGLSSATTADGRSHHSGARFLPAVSDDSQMGMSSIPVDVQTVISEDLDNPNHPNNRTSISDRALPPSPMESSAQRLPLNVADMVPEHDTDNHPGGPSSPPAYTARTAGPEPPLNLMPPSYATALAVPELRVGGQGLVTRKNIPRTRDDLWV